MRRVFDFESDLARAAETVSRGGVIIYPTDTVWGIGCDATDAEAVKRVFAIKHRDDSKALITLMTKEMVDEYLPCLPETCRRELDYDVRPTTVICPHAEGLALNLIASDGSVGVRVPREKFSEALCQAVGKPIVSTSVNISGESAPAIFEEIKPRLLEEVDYVVFYRRDDRRKSEASRIVAFDSEGNLKVLRE